MTNKHPDLQQEKPATTLLSQRIAIYPAGFHQFPISPPQVVEYHQTMPARGPGSERCHGVKHGWRLSRERLSGVYDRYPYSELSFLVLFDKYRGFKQ